jgi:hypothetical protein
MNGAGYVFETIKEHRGSYFVEYSPARAGDYFASLDLVFTDKPTHDEIPPIMERESEIWIRRYPVPLMITAFDDANGMIHVQNERGCDCLTALPEKDAIVFHWKLLKDDEFPSGAWEENQLLDIYRDIPYTTQAERVRDAVSSVKARRRGLVIIALWVVAVPVVVWLVGIASPILGGFVILYSIGKAIWQAMKMLGYVGRSEREKKKDAEELRMQHHHYYCKRNPEGFNRLKIECLEREAKERTQREAKELKRLQDKGGSS